MGKETSTVWGQFEQIAVSLCPLSEVRPDLLYTQCGNERLFFPNGLTLQRSPDSHQKLKTNQHEAVSEAGFQIFRTLFWRDGGVWGGQGGPLPSGV